MANWGSGIPSSSDTFPRQEHLESFLPESVLTYWEINCYKLGDVGVNADCCRMPQVCALFIRALNLKAQESSAAVLQGLCYKVLH